MFRGMNPVKVYRVESSSKPGKYYYIMEWPNGKFTCNCPSFLYGKHQRGLDVFDRECKHTVRVRERARARMRVAREEPELVEEPEMAEIDPRIKALIAQTLEKAG